MRPLGFPVYANAIMHCRAPADCSYYHPSRRRRYRTAVGRGFELALSANLILAAEHVGFVLTEIKADTMTDAATVKIPK